MSLPRQQTEYSWEEILQQLDIGQLTKSKASINLCHERCKEMMVDCRRSNNDTRAAELSQIKESLKKISDRFCRCGKWKSRQAQYCPDCWLLVRHDNNRRLPDKTVSTLREETNMSSQFGFFAGLMNIEGQLYNTWLIAFKA